MRDRKKEIIEEITRLTLELDTMDGENTPLDKAYEKMSMNDALEAMGEINIEDDYEPIALKALKSECRTDEDLYNFMEGYRLENEETTIGKTHKVIDGVIEALNQKIEVIDGTIARLQEEADFLIVQADNLMIESNNMHAYR